MAIVPMIKVTVFGHKNDRSGIIKILQHKGNVQVEDTDGEHEKAAASELSIIERQIGLIGSALSIVSEYDGGKKPLFASKKQVNDDAYSAAKKSKDTTLKTVYAINGAKKDITDNLNSIARLKAQIQSYEPWRGYAMQLSYNGSKNSYLFIGTLPTQTDIDEFTQALSAEFVSSFVRVISRGSEQTALAILCYRPNRFEVEAFLRSYGFTKPSFDLPNRTAVEEIHELENQISTLENKNEQLKHDLEFYGKNREELKLLYDYFLTAKERRDVRSKISHTVSSFILSGYTPTADAEELKAELEEKYGCYVLISEIGEEDILPVKFDNNAFVEPVEPVTEMFSYPSKTDVDPNPIMSVFYYLFFGLMLSDAGYGVLLVLVCSYITYKYKPEGMMGKMIRMFIFCGMGTIFWGALFGSWFGDIIPQVSKAFFGKEIGDLGIYNPITDPMPLLILSFVLGIIHLFTGMGVNFYNLVRRGKVWDAVFDVGFWYLFLIGLIMLIPIAPLGAGIVAEVGKWLAIGGAVGLLLTQGRSKANIFARLFGGMTSLYGVTSYLSDVLSYSRLLALGLATGVIANVVNTMAVMGGKNIFGVIMLIVIFLLGHTMNLLINMLGAYVHTNRLHYVEFFQKFYEGGGSKFTPFGMNTKYTKI